MSGRAWLFGGLVLALVVIAGRRTVFATKAGAVPSTRPEMEHARRIVAQVWGSRGLTLTVTSGTDGTHRADSLHYAGLAEDYRTRDLSAATVQAMAGEIRALLGRAYDVIVEPTHLHVEYDPT